MIHLYKKLNKFIVVLGMVAFLGMGFLTLVYVGISMEAGKEMPALKCPFMSGEMSICNMGPLDHVSIWQSLFSNFILPVLLIVFIVQRHYLMSMIAIKTSTTRSFAVYRDRSSDITPTALSLAFSQGILNPKIY